MRAFLPPGPGEPVALSKDESQRGCAMMLWRNWLGRVRPTSKVATPFRWLETGSFAVFSRDADTNADTDPRPFQGELLNPCRCDGSVRYTHQLCLLKWISERGSWTCELCCYRYHVIAIKMKQPCQWQSISITLVEKVQMIAVILGSLFLIASVTWLLWSAFSPYAVWQRKDILFQICYGMYGFMDLVCIGLIVHEGAAVYRVFKRWRAVNLHWDVLNYDKATDIEESSRGESSTSRTLWLPLTALRNRNLVHPTQLTSPRFQCGYVLLHLFNRMRPHEDLSEDNSSGEVVMRVTSV
ncbi:E3 ubiquitin-protein ligase MARCH11 [Tupaia chinensis]|uniref:E3 ubiquitin-protein ligase MARCH11 n=1 Tax=Tupaia chinensis TaxID=246437 RepID=UPI000FFB1A2C|nr:E3 ubiquitin-protein ligase MARCH11 [Tupaia chinensis]